MRLNQIARQLNIATESIVTYLAQEGIKITNQPNTKLSAEQASLVGKKFGTTNAKKVEKINSTTKLSSNTLSTSASPKLVIDEEALKIEPISTNFKQKGTKLVKKKTPPESLPKKNSTTSTSAKKTTTPPALEELSSPPANENPVQEESSPVLPGPKITVLGEIRMPQRQQAKESSKQPKQKRQRTRIIRHFHASSFTRPNIVSTSDKKPTKRKNVINKIKRREYREKKQEKHATRRKKQVTQPLVKVTEFISAHELAPLLDVSVENILDICMNLGMKVSMNQRLNRETITIIAEEINRQVKFISIEEEMAGQATTDDEQNLVPSSPVVTVMGHVDHGKTSLLDFIRKTKITQQESGGITQHIGAYDVDMPNGRRVVFLDTPGHQAFTAMRARGAKITDVAIIIIAANDGVKPQTKEAISHAQIAGLPIVIALNKIDHPEADIDRVKQELAAMNILVEDWGGNYQCQAISAKTGEGIDQLLEKVLLEADVLELKSNPSKKAQGTIIEASMKKGQGYLATVMVQQGTLKKGDILVAGSYFGKVKAIFDSHGKQVKQVSPATPVQVLGLNGAPDAGQVCRVMSTDKEARLLANRYKSIVQEQKLRSKDQVIKKKQEYLFEEKQAQTIPILIKGDVSGSVEALADSLLLLSNDHVHIHILYKGVGPISESDVLLAATSEALIIGFHTAVSPQAANVQARENVTIKNYKIIYEAIEDMKSHIESLEEPLAKEKVVIGKAEVRKTFYISRIGTIAGCYVKEGIIKRNADIRLIRDGETCYEGPMKQLKREKEVIKEARADSECGISIDSFNNIQEGDLIEAIE
ncbi:MAG: translation initiation factor IF-2 [Bacteroidota bacterium]